MATAFPAAAVICVACGGLAGREAEVGFDPALPPVVGLSDPAVPDAVQGTAEDLRRILFGDAPSVFAHVVEKDGQIVAAAIWFLNFSAFTGRHGIYLEDLFVRESERRHGYGRALGAVGMDEWKVQRLSGDALTRLATS